MATPSVRPAPLTDAEWARDITRRVQSGATPAAARAGDWAIADRDGRLVATNLTGDLIDLSTLMEQVSELHGQIAELSERITALEDG